MKKRTADRGGPSTITAVDRVPNAHLLVAGIFTVY